MEYHDSNLHIHPFPPIYEKTSKTLILGTFPSVKSRENAFYYGHKKNRFWPLLADLFCEKIPLTTDEKIAFLHRNHIAIWDVIKSCDIVGSSDQSIKNVVPNDISSILNQTQIQNIYANGTKSYDLYQKYILPSSNFPIKKLPSTSPANAACSFDCLVQSWKTILD